MNDALIRSDQATVETTTRERCHIREILNHSRVPGASLARCRVEPGVTTELHRLAVDEWYVVELGQGLMEVGDRAPFDIGPGDVVEIPAGTPQRVTNTGSGDLVFQCLCLPRFRPECYTALE